MILLLACADPPLEVEVEEDRSGLVVSANQPIHRIAVRRDGSLVTEVSVSPPAPRAVVRMPTLQPAMVAVTAGLQQERVLFEPLSTDPLAFWVEAPLGQGRMSQAVELPDGRPVRAGLVLESRRDRSVSWAVPGRTGEADLKGGERQIVPFELAGDSVVRVNETALPVGTKHVDSKDLIEQIQWEVVVPADVEGNPDSTAPDGRIVLPAPWWDRFLDELGVGFRVRDDQVPRSAFGVRLHNAGDRSRDLLLTAAPTGSMAAAFRPRLRDEQLDRVVRRVRVPAQGSVTAALPLYLDRSLVPETIEAGFEVSVQLLGAEEPLETRQVSVVVERGTRWASAVFGLGLISAACGWTVLLLRFRSWVNRPTRELTTLAMFAAASFTVGAATQVVGLGFASVLGPFAPFVLGVIDDAVRMCLAATLICLVPRVGVSSLALLLAWVMRAVVLGAAHPIDVLYLGSAVTLSESALFLSGVTRGQLSTGWRRAVQLVVGLAIPHAAGVLLALAVSSVLYRLFWAELYVGAVVALPGFLYAAVGCALAVPFVDRVLR